MAMPAGDDAGVPFGVKREILRIGRKGEPLLPDRRGGPIGAADALDLLPLLIGVIEMTEDRLQPWLFRTRGGDFADDVLPCPKNEPEIYALKRAHPRLVK
jgi:hypothetical protein